MVTFLKITWDSNIEYWKQRMGYLLSNLQSRKCGLIVSDVVMPGIGITLCAKAESLLIFRNPAYSPHCHELESLAQGLMSLLQNLLVMLCWNLR